MYKNTVGKGAGEKGWKMFCVKGRDILCARTPEGNKMQGSISPSFEGMS